MILRTLVLEGLARHEKANGLFPIRWKTHYLTEMFLACLPKATIDGSGKIAIAANNPDVYSINPNQAHYHRHEHAGVSVYHLNDEQIDTLYRIEPHKIRETRTQSYKRIKQEALEGELELSPEQGEEYILALVGDVVGDIARQANGTGSTVEAIGETVRRMKEMNCRYEEKMERLSKTSRDRRFKAEAFRCLGRDIGEAWRLVLTTKDDKQYREWITDVPGYMDRLDFFKRAAWNGGVFSLSDNLGNIVVRANMNEPSPLLTVMFLKAKSMVPLP